MEHSKDRFDVVAIALNPAIDRTLTISDFAAGKLNRVDSERVQPGGKAVNVARALADYGYSVAITGFLGGENAAPFADLFQRKGIKDECFRLAGPTREDIKIFDPVQRVTTEINSIGLTLAVTDVYALRDRIAKLNASWFVISGSIPPGLDPAGYADLVRRLKGRGAKVAVDTSGEALRAAVQAAPDVIKPNREELETWAGNRLESPAAAIAAAQTMVDRGPGMVAVSLGAEGACFVTRRGIVTARPPAIEVNSTAGAGDAMLAGIVSAQLWGFPLADCAQLATAFSVAVLTHRDSGTITPAMVEAVLENIQVEPA